MEWKQASTGNGEIAFVNDAQGRSVRLRWYYGDGGTLHTEVKHPLAYVTTVIPQSPMAARRAAESTAQFIMNNLY